MREGKGQTAEQRGTAVVRGRNGEEGEAERAPDSSLVIRSPRQGDGTSGTFGASERSAHPAGTEGLPSGG